MRLIFVATGDIALPAFRYLLENGPLPLALVTQPDKPVGRHQTLTPPAIKIAALEAGIPIFQPERISEAFEELSALEPEIIVVMAYGQILRNDILTLPSKAIINLHASLLPLYRGAACIQAAIDAGDSETGITAIHVVRALDAGDMICAKSIPITAEETGGSLHDRLAELAPEVMAEALAKIEQGTADSVSQDPEKSTYISKLERDHGRIDWSMDATSIERRIRAYDPWPGTYTTILEGGKSKRVKIFPPTETSDRVIEPGVVVIDEGLFVGCGKGALKITSLQPEGSKRMSTSDYLRGKRPERFE